MNVQEIPPSAEGLPDPGSEQRIYDEHRQAVAPMRVISVEDQKSIRIQLQHMLQRAGHRATFCHDATRALEHLKREQFDVLVLDIHMPGPSGLDLLQTISSLRGSAAHAPSVVVLTGDLDPETRARAVEGGVAAFLTKPPRSEQLLAALRRIHDQRSLAGTVGAPALS